MTEQRESAVQVVRRGEDPGLSGVRTPNAAFLRPAPLLSSQGFSCSVCASEVYKLHCWASKMAWRLTALSALPKDLGSTSKTHMVHNGL